MLPLPVAELVVAVAVDEPLATAGVVVEVLLVYPADELGVDAVELELGVDVAELEGFDAVELEGVDVDPVDFAVLALLLEFLDVL